ncbi:tetratricopeptide repeat protein [Mucilaginibacter flavidus]|uniref:tetratricopeptide repeat protein n=1 Tax=Mucilaginibacter flavidus TaxID=2949309 RepID=UPI00209344AE|nr:tetratricopeptide repeat protein [Mucilaginibacter flavidus]MCO5949799.1 tetratricopeptide repeat protein [Mucilaginibacter flavidus]
MNSLEKIQKVGKTLLETYRAYKEIFFIIISCVIPFIFKIYEDNYKFYISVMVCILIVGILTYIILSQKKTSLIRSSADSILSLPKYQYRNRYLLIAALILLPALIFSIYKLRNEFKINKNKILVLIIPFKNETDSSRDIFAAKLYGELNEQLDTDKSIKIELLETPISESAGGITKAKAIAREKKAAIVIWGWYSKSPTDIYLKTKFEILDSTIQNVKHDLSIQNEQSTFKISQLNSFELQSQVTNNNSFLVFSCIGYLEYVQYKWYSAISYFNKALNFKSSDINKSTINLFKGNSFYELNTNDSAAFYYRQAIKYNKKYVPSYIGLGNVYGKSNEFALALKCYDEALYYDSDDLMAYNNKGIVYIKTHKYDLAEDCFNHAFMIYPGDSTTLTNMAMFIEMKNKYEHDVEINEKGKNPKLLYQALIRRCAYYYWSKLYKKALSDINLCINLAPDSANLYILRGDIEDDGENKTEASLHDYSYAVKLNPQNSHAYYERAVIYKRSGQLKRAIADYNKSILIKPSAEAYNNIGGIYMNLKMYKQAYDEFKSAHEIALPIDSSSYGDHMRMAQYYIQKGAKKHY